MLGQMFTRRCPDQTADLTPVGPALASTGIQNRPQTNVSLTPSQARIAMSYGGRSSLTAPSRTTPYQR